MLLAKYIRLALLVQIRNQSPDEVTVTYGDKECRERRMGYQDDPCGHPYILCRDRSFYVLDNF